MTQKVYTTYGGNLRTINFSIEELNSLQLVSTYAKKNNYSISAVYYAIHQGKLPAKKIKGRYRVLPTKLTDAKLVR